MEEEGEAAGDLLEAPDLRDGVVGGTDDGAVAGGDVGDLASSAEMLWPTVPVM